MKKFFIATALISLFVAGLASCKTTADCPAYPSHSEIQVESNTDIA